MKKITWILVLIITVYACGNDDLGVAVEDITDEVVVEEDLSNEDIVEDVIGGEVVERKTTVKNRTSLIAFGNEVFRLLKQGNYENILNLYPNVNSYKSLIKKSKLSDKMKERGVSQIEASLKKDLSSLKSSYDALKIKSEGEGVVWKSTKLDYIDFDYKSEGQIEFATLYLNILFHGINYKIELKNCIKINGAWKIGKSIKWNTRSRSHSSLICGGYGY